MDIKRCQISTKIYIYKNEYKNCRFKHIIFSKYAINLNDDTPEEPENLGLLLLLFEFNNFKFLIDIIDKIGFMSVSPPVSDRSLISLGQLLKSLVPLSL